MEVEEEDLEELCPFPTTKTVSLDDLLELIELLFEWQPPRLDLELEDEDEEEL